MFCPACGKEVDETAMTCPYCGAGLQIPSQAAKPRKTSPAVIAIIVVAVGIFVLAIIGIIAAIAIPSLVSATQRSKQKQTMADMRAIGTAIETYHIDNWAYPESGAENLKILEPFYIIKVPAKDAWENNFWYIYDSEQQNYSLGSGGRDGSTPNWNMYPTTTTSFDDDIIFFDGQFTVYPEGIQT